MLFDRYGRAYTRDRAEAYKYRFPDKSPDRGAKNSGQVYQKMVKMYHYDKLNKVYWLPPKFHNKNFNLNIHKIDIKDVSHLFVDDPGSTFSKLTTGQRDTINTIIEQLLNGVNSAMIISTVGTGKSQMSLGICSKLGTRTLITVPSNAIGQGMYDKFKGNCEVEFFNGAQIRKFYDKYKRLPDVLIAHRQSAVNTFDLLNGYYTLLINDEQHHLSNGMKMICNQWKGKWIVGLTGTPFRKEMDESDFEKWYFQFMYHTGLKSLDVEVFTYKFRHTYSQMDYVRASEGYNPEAAEVWRRLLNSNPKRVEALKEIIKRLYYELGFRRIMVFVDRRDYQEEIASHFTNTILVNGDSDKKEVLDKMATEDQYLAIGMVGASGEGFDAPGVEIGILFYSTQWEGSLEQMIGRARRFGKGKTKAYRLDFQDISTIETGIKKDFGSRQRIKYYATKGWNVREFGTVKSLD